MQTKQACNSHKILFLDHTAQLGGGELALLHLLEALDKSLITPVVILASEGPLTSRIKRLGIKVSVLPLDPEVVNTRKNSLGFSAVLKLKSVINVIRYSYRLAKLAQRLGISLILTNSL